MREREREGEREGGKEDSERKLGGGSVGERVGGWDGIKRGGGREEKRKRDRGRRRGGIIWSGK
jgi:hypothetical protein